MMDYDTLTMEKDFETGTLVAPPEVVRDLRRCRGLIVTTRHHPCYRS
jgi:hypothetical protein